LKRAQYNERKQHELRSFYDSIVENQGEQEPGHDISNSQANEEDTDTSSTQGGYLFDLAFKLLDSFREKRSRDQKRMHDSIFETMAPVIFGPDYNHCRVKLLKRFKRVEPVTGTMITCPRRWGKTTGVAMAIAVGMYIGRKINFLVFSTGQDMSTAFMDKVKTFFLQLPDAKDRIILSNTKLFLTKSMDAIQQSKTYAKQAGMFNSLKARPATVQGNKGVTADVFVLEEASRIPRQILHEVIAPMFKVNNAVLLALSTLTEHDNYYTKLFDSQDPMMDVMFIRLRIELYCETCKQSKSGASDCKHLEHLHPPWLSGSNNDKVKVLMEGNEQMFAQEVMGTVAQGGGGVFKQEWLQQVQKSTRFDLLVPRFRLKFLVTVVDPAGGGASKTAIFTIAKGQNEHIVLVGLAEAPTKTQVDVSELTRKYFSSFLKYTGSLRTLPHYICVENNYGGGLIADVITNMARTVIPTLIEYRTHPERPGVVTTNNVKCTAVMTVTWSLHAKQIHISSALFSQYGGFQDDATAAALEEFLTQMTSLRQEMTGNGRMRYTAKDKNGQQDDMCIALLLAAHHAVLINMSMGETAYEDERVYSQQAQASMR
jgi:hypothetical protein